MGDYVLKANAPNLVKSRKRRVNLNAWISPDCPVENVGDYLSYVIVNAMCEANAINMEKEISKTKHLYAIGSILMGYQNATIWGSGFNFMRSDTWKNRIDNSIHLVRHSLDVRAVRGPITRTIIQNMGYMCPEIYGDPAVLLPLFYKKERTHEREYIIVPHYSKLEKSIYKGNKNVLCSFKSDWKEFVDTILQADFVISSSLHGIIIAESYGIPAVMLKDTPCSDITKYKDWYLSTHRADFPIVDTIEEALLTKPSVLDRSVLESMQCNLINTFPKDLWE